MSPRIATGDLVISPDTSPAWAPFRVTEAVTSPSGITHLRIHKMASMGWMRAEGWLHAPAGAVFTNQNRWIKDGKDITPKRADLPINAMEGAA